MQENHYRQAGSQNGSSVTYQSRSHDTTPKGDSTYTVESSEEVPVKIRGEDNISKTDMKILDIGKIPENAKILMLQNVDVDKNDAFEFDSTTYEVFKVADHYGEGGKKIGQRVLVRPET